MRTFICVKISKELRDEIEEIYSHLENVPELENVRWTPLENLHVTLKFLGDVDSETVDLLKYSLSQSIAHLSPFESQLEKVHCFPNNHNPRIIVIDFKNPSPWMDLAKTVAQTTNQAGFDIEKRPFEPHITIGRIKNSSIDFDFNALSMDSTTMQVSEISIMKSIQAKGRMFYEEIESIKL